MNKLPKSGLIVCVQTHDWRKYRSAYAVIEAVLIDILANNKDVVGLRIDNPLLISYARNKYKNLFILGMYKDHDHPNYITPTLEHYNKCIDAGADAVAVDFRVNRPEDKELVEWAFDESIKDYIWPDVDSPGAAQVIFDHYNFSIASSTFCNDQKYFLEYAEEYKFLDKINIEGNVNSSNFELFYKKAKYVTVGRVIHDPSTIIKNLIG